MKQVSLLTSFNNTIIHFGEFVLNTQNGELRKDNALVKIEPQLLEFLLLLIKQKLLGEDAIVTRALMIDSIWSGKSASDDAVRAVVKKLREVLNDDARRPRYIKTIPTKGYLLICEIEQRAQGRSAWKQRSIKYGVVALLAVALFAGIQLTYLWYTSEDHAPKRISSLKVITEASKTFVSADLHNENKILYSKIAENEKSLQLYVKSIHNDDGTRLTWDQNYDHQARWSGDGKYILLRKSNSSGTESSVYSYPEMKKVFDEKNIASVNNSTEQTQNQLKAIAWLHDEDQILIYEIDQEAPNQVALYAYSINGKKLKLKTSIALKVSQIKEIEVSKDSQFLAIYYQDTKGHFSLTIYNRFTNEIIDTLRLQNKIDRLVWDDDSQLVSFLTEEEGLRSYDITARKYFNWKGLKPGIQSLISQCGSACFMFTRHDGDFLDISERPSPFVAQDILPTRLIASPGLDDLPIFGSDGSLFFVTRKDGRSLIEKRDLNNQQHQVFELPSSGTVGSLALNKANNAFIGELNQRIFLYRLDTGIFSFVTGIKEKAMEPSWLADDSGFSFYIKDKQITGDTNQFANNDVSTDFPVYYHYDLSTSSKRELGRQFHSIVNFENNSFLVSKVPGEYFLLTANAIEELFQDERYLKANQSKEVIRIPDSSPNAFKIIGKKLYYLDSLENDTVLSTLDISTLKKQSYPLDTNPQNPNFTLSSDLSKLVVTRTKSNASQIVKVEGLWLE
ncbi:winged helix-turn-helix domain-containing protein [Glaciecola sp. KUL10]|uniref:winged helix-turn-helix domain-containing protein n=1 Tax=Glaciecola sp. (strain KUL10) TaxID=2161813 RepID=UPI000D80C4C6|nr:winged helix-turn-helix domain-containing protein [Glaciecola sp. KUL10]GBL05688.1 transcriptional regulator [Glaciecola sp. KUL10]